MLFERLEKPTHFALLIGLLALWLPASLLADPTSAKPARA